jgi:RNA polymerase sigma factor (TIGR02999 family)
LALLAGPGGLPALSASQDSEIARILAKACEGDPQSSAELLPLVYEELRKLARQRLKHEPPGHTLQATALVHEAYLRLLADPGVCWNGRRHFFAAAAEAMRRILVERARKYHRLKHGGGRRRFALDNVDPAEREESGELLIDLDQALRKLEAGDTVRSEVVKLRYFAGLTIEQTADVLGISPATVKRQWTFAQAWLCHEITRGDTAAIRDFDEPIARPPSH